MTAERLPFGQRPRIDPAEARALYESGLPLRVLAERYRTTKEAVRQVLIHAGVAMRRRGGNQGPHSRHRRR